MMDVANAARDDGAKFVGTIDLTPTWVGLIPLFVTAIEHGTPVARAGAIEELYRLAAYADDMKARPRNGDIA